MSKRSRRGFLCFKLGVKHEVEGGGGGKISPSIRKHPSYDRGRRIGEHYRELGLRWKTVKLRLERYSP